MLTDSLRTDDHERGSVSLLIIGLAVVLLLIASTVIAITSVYIDYKKLQDVADQTALSVAQEVRGLEYLSGPSARLKEETVQEIARDFLNTTGAGKSLSGIELTQPTGLLEENTAQITLVARADIPMISSLLPISVEIEASGIAQTQLNR